MIPKTIRDLEGLKSGDDFEVLLDEGSPDIILSRHLQSSANAGLVDHLLACSYKGLRAPKRRLEKMRNLRL